ncbi:hypothetical protein RRG08_027907 [Elysia crispata]|uniref:Uncharacterized protein n=1 Tax=Elysia crispata TaxID=231223 RepID=A0AAE1A6U0_9GAST|nr:hypothetical protein RRG08_027907 [Elysia crispata]
MPHYLRNIWDDGGLCKEDTVANMWYLTIVSDSNDKAYNAVLKLQANGPDCPIEKAESINHQEESCSSNRASQQAIALENTVQELVNV